MSATLKLYHVQNCKIEDLPIIKYACEYSLCEIQSRIDEILKNYPNRIAAFFLRLIIFPTGMHFEKPKDKLNHQISQLLMAPTESRDRLCAGAYLSPTKENVLFQLNEALQKIIAAEPIDKIIKEAKQDGQIKSHSVTDQALEAKEKNIITAAEYDIVREAEEARGQVIAVDDFSNEDLQRNLLVETYQKLYESSNGTHG